MKLIASLLVLVLLFGCSNTKTDKALFDEAQKFLTENKIPEAVTALEEIINKYPESNLAPEALQKLATAYQNKLVKSLSENENLQKAVELFKKLHDDYPESNYAAPGLFMAGFINANELKNFDEATKIYQQFLKEYPNYELTASAQAELDNMGLTPEEILKKNLTKEEK